MTKTKQPTNTKMKDEKEATRLKSLAEKTYKTTNSITTALKHANRAQELCPTLPGITAMVSAFNVLSLCTSSSSPPEYYSLLGLSPFSSPSSIKAQYRKLALLLHPDKRGGGGSDGSCGALEEAMKWVNEAFGVLSDRARRKEYDVRLRLEIIEREEKGESEGEEDEEEEEEEEVIKVASVSEVMRRESEAREVEGKKRGKGEVEEELESEMTLAEMMVNGKGGEKGRVERREKRGKGKEREMTLAEMLGGEEREKSVGNRARRGKELEGNEESDEERIGNGVRKQGRSRVGEGSVKEMTLSEMLSDEEGTREDDVGETIGERMRRRRKEGFKREKTLVEIWSEDIRMKDMRRKTSERRRRGRGKERSVEVSSDEEETGMENRKARNGARKKGRSGVEEELQGEMTLEEMKSEALKKLKGGKVETAEEKVRKGRVDEEEEEEEEEEVVVEKRRKVVTENGDIEVMTVEDSEFYDFDVDRVGRNFKKGQVWAIYDDDDGMPRHYGLIDEVVSVKPFAVKMSWFDLQSGGDERLVSWEKMGFRIACGKFKVAKNDIINMLNIFSHMVECERAARELYRIYPRKGSVWALYDERALDTGGGDGMSIDKRCYDIVVLLTSYNDMHGLSIAYLEKADGFKAVFRRREIGYHAVRWLEKDDIRLFSHQIPARKLTGNEVPDMSGDCWELDPASLPPELLTVAPG